MSFYYSKQRKRWCIDVTRRGRRIVRYAKKGTTRNEAKEFEARVINEFDSVKIPRQASDRFISEAIKRWIEEEVSTYKSKTQTINHIKQVADYIVGRKLTNIHLVAEEYTRDHKGAISNGTINRRLSMLRLIANLAYKKWDWLDRPLGQKIKLLKETTGRVPLITRKEVDAILRHIEDPRCKLAVCLAAFCGLRAGEIQRLRPEHVKKGHLWLEFDQKSGVNIETVPIPAALNLRPGMFPLGISYRMISRRFNDALRGVGREDLRFHDLRHAYGSWLVQNGVDLYLTGKLLRHKSLASTKRYAHFTNTQKQDAVDKVFG